MEYSKKNKQKNRGNIGLFHICHLFFFLNSVFVKTAAIPQAVSLKEKFWTPLLFGAEMPLLPPVVP